eukprot:s428_g20.t1
MLGESRQKMYPPNDDEEEKLFLFVQNQKVMGAQELGRVEIGSDKMKQLLKDGQRRGGNIQWTDASFTTSFQLIPRGQIWVTAVPVEEEYHGYSAKRAGYLLSSFFAVLGS